MARLVNIDGLLLPPDKAVVSVFDRGFLYGDSVYEVLRTYGGRPFEMDAHLARLDRSAELIGMAMPRARAGLVDEMRRTLAAAGNAESYLRVIVTRGTGEIGLDPALGEKPTTIIIVRELVVPPPEVYERGVAVALVGVRRNLRQAIDPQAKTGNYLNSVLAVGEAKKLGAHDALMLDHLGRVTEGGNSNVFAVLHGRLVTPSLETGLLPGVTRRIVLGIAAAQGLAVVEREVWPADLEQAEEIFVTSTTRELVPVVRVLAGDSAWTVGDGRPGQATRRLLAAFRSRACADGE